MNAERFTLETEDKILTCEVILRLYVEKYKKNYLVYTDGSIDKEGEENVFISSYLPNDEKGELKDITDENELKYVSDYIEKIWENIND